MLCPSLVLSKWNLSIPLVLRGAVCKHRRRQRSDPIRSDPIQRDPTEVEWGEAPHCVFVRSRRSRSHFLIEIYFIFDSSIRRFVVHKNNLEATERIWKTPSWKQLREFGKRLRGLRKLYIRILLTATDAHHTTKVDAHDCQGGLVVR